MVRSRLARLVLGMSLVGGVGCNQGDAVDPAGRPPSERFLVSIANDQDSVDIGATLALTARVVDARGNARSDQPVQWRSLAPDIASVDGVGLVTAISLGSAPVVASVGSGASLHADTATVVVRRGTVLLTIRPSLAEIALGDSVRLEASFGGGAGSGLRNATPRWTTSDSKVAPISPDGTVLSLAPGDVVLTAEVNGMTATAVARVLPNPVASIGVEPANSGLYPGESVQLRAYARDSRGRPLPRAEITWSTSAPAVAIVSADGLVTARSQGSAIISATADGRRASATVTVYAVAANSVTVTAPSSSVPLGGRLQAVATARDADGNVLANKTVAWSSSNPSVAQVSADGMITGLVVGNTTINAIVDSKIGSLPVSVVSVAPASLSVAPASATISLGSTTQLSAELRDQNGNPVGGTVNWASANGSVASVSSAGVVTALAAGTTDIVASSGSLSARASITVTAAGVASVSISPAGVQLDVGRTQQFSVSVLSTSGAPVASPAVTWRSSNPAVVTVGTSGLATAVAAGTASITATSSGVSGSASVTVNAPPATVASVSVTFNSPSLFVGQSTQAVATARDASGSIITGKPVTWISSDVPLATVSSSGLVTAIASGTATIVAKIDNAFGSASLAIGAPTPLPVHSVQLSVSPSALAAGQQGNTTVTLRDSLGNTLSPVGRTISYASSRPTVATVGFGGVVTAVAGGTSDISATSEGKTGSAPVTVQTVSTPVSVASVSLTAPQTTLTSGQTSQATAVARDSAGNALSGQTFTWASSNPAAATVSGTGLVTAIAAGASTISASSGGKTATLVFTVLAPATASIALTVPSTSLTVGQTVQAIADAKDASGNTLSGKPIAWASSNSSVASVSQAGLITALASGSATITASNEGRSASASITVSAPVSSGPVPSVQAALPQATVNTAWRAPTGRSIIVRSGDNLQSALNTAQRGDEVVLDAGATFVGNFVLPAKPGTSANGWITVRTNALNSLPPLGSRINAAQHAQYMPKIVTSNLMDALRTAAGASGWRLVGLEVTITPGVATYPEVNNGLLLLGDGSGAQNSMSLVPQDIILDRMYVHGQSTTNLKRCIALNSGATAIIGSQILECHGKGFDSQAIGGWNGPGPYLIENNRLEGAGEVIIFGGSDPAIAGLITSDVTIRGNYLTRPMSWQGQWTVKNIFELKNAQRVLLENNRLDNNWVDAQAGSAIVLGSVNQDGTCPQCIVADVTFQYNQVHNVAAVFNIFARCGRTAPGGNYGCGQGGQQTRRVTIRHNLFTNVGAAGLGAGGSVARIFMLTDDVHDILIENNTGFAPYSYLTFNGTGSFAKERFTFQANIGGGSQYDWFSSSGMGDAASNASLKPGFLIARNGFVASGSSLIPSGSLRAATVPDVRFVNPSAPVGDWSLLSSSPFFPAGAGVNFASLMARLSGVAQ